MKLETLYWEIVKKGIEADLRGKEEIEKILQQRSRDYAKLDAKEKRFFDKDSLSNPFADTRLLHGDLKSDVKSMIVGIDVEGPELLLDDRLKQRGTDIDLVAAHHPEGRAFANFYEVMDLQVKVFTNEGVSLGASQNLLAERKAEVERRVSAANHTRSVDIARLLDLNFLCMHTVCDNLAYQYMDKILKGKNPETLGDILDLLYSVPEYEQAAKNNNPPKIVIGSKSSRCQRIHLEFTGGTEGPKNIYSQLSSAGVDTIIAMHQSEEHYKKCKEANINVIFASHIASDNLGINEMLDYLEGKEKMKVYEFSGFTRVKRINK